MLFLFLSQGSGHPVVEAIQQVLGDKTLSDLVIPNSVNGESPSFYHSQTTPILPLYSALRAPQKTSTLPLNLPASQIYPVTTESLLALPPNQTTAHHMRSPVVTARGELAPLSQLSSLPDNVMSHLINLCPPINSQAHPNAANRSPAQATFHFAPASTMPNQSIHLGVTMPNLATTERFLGTAHSNTLSSLQSSSNGMVPAQTPMRSFNLVAGNMQSGSQSAIPSPVQPQQETFSTRAIQAVQLHPGIDMPRPAQSSASYSFSSNSALSNLVTSASLFNGSTETVPLASYSDNNQQVPDSSQSPEIRANSSENQALSAQVGFEVKMEEIHENDMARSSEECRNNFASTPDNADPGGTTIPIPSQDQTPLSTASSNSNNNMTDHSASSFLRRLSQGGMDTGGNSDDTDAHSPMKQFHQDHQARLQRQDCFMSDIKTEMM